MVRASSFKNIVKFILVSLIFFFILRVLYQNWNQLSNYRLHFNYYFLVSSMCVLIAAYFISNFTWYLLTEKINISLDYMSSTKNWFYSQLWRYIPGKFGIIFGRAYLYHKEGISVKLTSFAALIETVITFISACIVFLLFFSFEEGLRSDIDININSILIVSSIAIIGMLVLLRPTIFQEIINFVLTLMKRERIKLEWSYFDSIKILCCYLLTWLVLGFAFHLFINSFVYVPLKKVFFLTGSLAFASVVSLISFFAPAGIGVREGILFILLSQILPESISVILSVASRVWFIMAEMVVVAMIKIVDMIIISRRRENIVNSDSIDLSK